MTSKEKVTKARASLILDHPFFGSLSLRMELKEDNTQETFWTDGKSIGYNSQFVDSLTMDEIKGVFMHEVLHPALGHHLRRGNRNSQIWNEACDYVVNGIVLNAKGVLPKDALINHNLSELNAEVVYDKIYREPDKENGGKGKGANSCGEVRDAKGEDDKELSEQEKSELEQEWKVAANQAAQQAKACGNLPSSLDRLITDLKEPKVNWKEALHRFVEQQTKNDYNWKRANKRHLQRGIILPSLHTVELPPIHIWIDTSGSVSSEDLKQFASEIDDILTNYPTTIQVVYCDSKVQHVEEFTKDNQPIKLNAKGGGGTRFSPAINWSMEQDEMPICGIYLTDLECSDFGKEPDFPVLWIQTEGRKREVPFGELIRMKSLT